MIERQAQMIGDGFYFHLMVNSFMLAELHRDAVKETLQELWTEYKKGAEELIAMEERERGAPGVECLYHCGACPECKRALSLAIESTPSEQSRASVDLIAQWFDETHDLAMCSALKQKICEMLDATRLSGWREGMTEAAAECEFEKHLQGFYLSRKLRSRVEESKG